MEEFDLLQYTKELSDKEIFKILKDMGFKADKKSGIATNGEYLMVCLGDNSQIVLRFNDFQIILSDFTSDVKSSAKFCANLAQNLQQSKNPKSLEYLAKSVQYWNSDDLYWAFGFESEKDNYKKMFIDELTRELSQSEPEKKNNGSTPPQPE